MKQSTWNPTLTQKSTQSNMRPQNADTHDFARETMNGQGSTSKAHFHRPEAASHGYSQSNSSTQGINSSSLNIQLKQQIQSLRNLDSELDKKMQAAVEQQCLSFIQHSIEKAREHMNLQVFAKMKDFLASQQYRDFKQNHAHVEDHLLTMKEEIASMISEGSHSLKKVEDQRKENLIKNMGLLGGQANELLGTYDPVEMEFDLETSA